MSISGVGSLNSIHTCCVSQVTTSLRPLKRRRDGIANAISLLRTALVAGLYGLTCGLLLSSSAAAQTGAYERAYELVTPPQKEAGFPGAAGLEPIGVSAPDGDSIAFQTFAPMPDAEGASIFNLNIARRGESGWSNTPVTPPQVPRASGAQYPQLHWFSEDLSVMAFVAADPPLVPGAQAGFNYLYLRDLNDKTFRLVSGTPLNGRVDAFMYFGGASEDLSHLVFGTLGGSVHTPDAPAVPANAWENVDGQLRLVTILPNGSPSPTGGRVGGGPATTGQNAVSADGSRIFFEASGSAGGAVQVYVREGGVSTIHVSASQRSAPDPNGPQDARFQAAAADGSAVLFTSAEELTDESNTGPSADGNDLYRFDVESRELVDLTVSTDPDSPNGAEVLGLLGASDDASRVYFVARGRLAEGAEPGEPNLYFVDGQDIEYIATLDEEDSNNWLAAPNRRSARVTPSGQHVIFTSVKSLTGYDNRHLYTGEPTRQIFRYDAQTAQLDCVSCNPSGERPIGEANIRWSGNADVRSHNQSRNISDDGKYVFFNSTDALVPKDQNGKQDVYEWAEGEVRIVSSPTSDWDSRFVDASADGSSVFFATREQLVPQDGDGFEDLYVARIGGGFPSPGDAVPCDLNCQGPPSSPPETEDPGSAVFQGPGNPNGRCEVLKRQALSAARRARDAGQRAQALRRKARRLQRSAKAASGERARRLSRRASKNRRQAAHLLAKSQRLNVKARTFRKAAEQCN
jgi:hypothetical protein